jgi:methionyl-tRNA synthetase
MSEEIKQINLEKEISAEVEEVEVKNKKISIEDFAKVEIKLGTVVDVKEVEGSDKLLRLTVDFGEEREIESESGNIEKEKHVRNVFSGIKKYVKIEDMIGKQFPFVTNLEPRKMMGEYSEAMIMAASEVVEIDGVKTEKFSLLNPSQVMSNGITLR